MTCTTSNACPECGAPTTVEKTDDGAGGCEYWGVVLPYVYWWVRACTECDWSMEVKDERGDDGED